jgi:hypothetical protein
LASEKEARVKTLLVSLLACLGSFLSVASAADRERQKKATSSDTVAGR